MRLAGPIANVVIVIILIVNPCSTFVLSKESATVSNEPKYSDNGKLFADEPKSKVCDQCLKITDFLDHMRIPPDVRPEEVARAVLDMCKHSWGGPREFCSAFSGHQMEYARAYLKAYPGQEERVCRQVGMCGK
ncbi:hypothetical protein Ddc_10934 [Ditylenchus destructor]|nr:hypothetical protein Ddc_10934 [Ditylenchus destructor]